MTKAEDLEKILGPEEGKVLIVDHEYSDPDGLGTKYNWKFIVKNKFGLESDIAYSKEIGHHKTQHLAKKFASIYDEQMKNIEDINLSDYGKIMLVDVNQYSNTIPFTKEQMDSINPKDLIVIDHHDKKAEETIKVGYEDIDLSYRSASTLTIEYLKQFGLQFSADNDEHQLLATSLWVGFEIDALGKLPYEKDYESLMYIIEKASSSIKQQIERGALPEAAYRASRKALANFERFGPYAVCYIYGLKADNKDTIAITAEDLLMMQGVEASISWALIDREIIGSTRTTDSVSIFANEVAESYEKYGFKGGGRPNAGGFNGEIGVLEHYLDEDEDQIIKAINNIITSEIKDKAE